MTEIKNRKKEELADLLNQLDQAQLNSVFYFLVAMEKKAKEEPDPELRYYTLKEIQPSFDVSYRTLQNWVKTGHLPCVRLGGKWRVKEEDWKRLLAEHKKSK